jgi:L,D-transpeptidase YcbB
MELPVKKTLSPMSRRGFARLALSGATAAFGFAHNANAAPGEGGFFGGQAEWAQKYDSDPRVAVTRSTTPVLSQQTIAATEAAMERYRQIAGTGGWGAVPGQTLKLGSNGPAVVALRRRLMASGDLDKSAGTSPVFDSFVVGGVKRFQSRHGLGETGVVAQQTIAALNVSAEIRLRQLEINLVRLRSFAGNLGNRFVMANIPAATVETVENGQVYSHHAAGVGKIDRQSPVMQAKATDINFNPYWTVPASIIRKDLIPKMQNDPNYLTENKIRIFNKENQEIQPSQINWNSLEATNYRFRQDTGGDINSMGVVRINIANPYGVYMHDTNSKGVFGDDYRFVSSGCIRLQNVRDYVAWLLKETPGWDRNKIDDVIRSGARVDARLVQAVPVYWVYITSWATPDGLVQFRDDIYHRDGFGNGTPSVAGGPGATQSAAQIQGKAAAVSGPASGVLEPMNDDE